MARSTWMAVGLIGLTLAGCATGPGRPPRGAMVAPRPCTDFKVSIYFNLYEDKLTREARSVLKSAGEMAEGCAVLKARVVGLSDAIGAADANLELSRRRAAAVTRALDKVGFEQVEFDVAAVGETGSVNAEGEAAPMRRRTDIFLHLTQPRARP